jgi:hypothetical protein
MKGLDPEGYCLAKNNLDGLPDMEYHFYRGAQKYTELDPDSLSPKY